MLDERVQPFEGEGVAVEAGELQAQQDQVEPLGVLVVIAFG